MSDMLESTIRELAIFKMLTDCGFSGIEAFNILNEDDNRFVIKRFLPECNCWVEYYNYDDAYYSYVMLENAL